LAERAYRRAEAYNVRAGQNLQKGSEFSEQIGGACARASF